MFLFVFRGKKINAACTYNCKMLKNKKKKLPLLIFHIRENRIEIMYPVWIFNIGEKKKNCRQKFSKTFFLLFDIEKA